MSLTLLITLGPTREYIDPVRFISNASSGKMGQAIINEAVKKNIKVIAIKGPCDIEIKSKKCKVIDVITAKQMLKAVKENLKFADIFIGSAAVADYRPVVFSKNKIKKKDVGSNILTLKLTKNPDIIKFVSKNKQNKVVVGFALESKNLISYAKEKLKNKNLDMVVANGVKTIGADKSTPTLLFKDGSIKKIKSETKSCVAKEIIDESIRLFKNNKVS